jgi:hypothetical protein
MGSYELGGIASRAEARSCNNSLMHALCFCSLDDERYPNQETIGIHRLTRIEQQAESKPTEWSIATCDWQDANNVFQSNESPGDDEANAFVATSLSAS